jgi:hypothetical protein
VIPVAVSTLKIPDAQLFKEISVTPTTNVVIDVNESCRQGNIGIIAVKGHTTATIINSTLFTVNSADRFKRPRGSTFLLGIGDEWNITDAGYGYAGGNSIIGRVQSGQYFHVLIPMIFE